MLQTLTFFTKQATQIRRSIVLNLPFQLVFPDYKWDVNATPELNRVKEWWLLDVIFIGSHRQLGVVSCCPVREVDRVDERVVVQELQPYQVGRLRRWHRDAEKTLAELLSRRRISERIGGRMRRKFRDGVNEPKSVGLVEDDDPFSVAHREAAACYKTFFLLWFDSYQVWKDWVFAWRADARQIETNCTDLCQP